MECETQNRPEQEEGVQEASLEELFAELDEILKAMESAETTLDESFALYEAGLKKLKLCNEKLDLIEKKMLILSQDQETEEFS